MGRMAPGWALASCALLATGCGYARDRVRDFGEIFRFEIGAGPGLGASVRGAGLLDLGATVACTPRLTSVGWRYGEAWAFGYGDNPRAWDAEVDITAPVDAAAIAVVAGLVAIAANAKDLHKSVHRSVHKSVRRAVGEVGVEVVDGIPPPPIHGPGHVRLIPVIPVVPPPRPQVAPENAGPAATAPSTREDAAPPERVTFGLHWIIEGSPRPTLNPALATHTSWQLLPCLMNWTYEPLPDAFPGIEGWVEARNRGWVWGPAGSRRARVHAFDIEASVYAGVIYTRVGISPGELVDFLAGLVGLDPAGDDRFGR